MTRALLSALSAHADQVQRTLIGSGIASPEDREKSHAVFCECVDVLDRNNVTLSQMVQVACALFCATIATVEQRARATVDPVDGKFDSSLLN